MIGTLRKALTKKDRDSQKMIGTPKRPYKKGYIGTPEEALKKG